MYVTGTTMSGGHKHTTSPVPPPPPLPSPAASRPAKKWPKVVVSTESALKNETADDDEEEEVGLPHDLPAKEIQDELEATRLEYLYDLLPEGMTPRTVFYPPYSRNGTSPHRRIRSRSGCST